MKDLELSKECVPQVLDQFEEFSLIKDFEFVHNSRHIQRNKMSLKCAFFYLAALDPQILLEREVVIRANLVLNSKSWMESPGSDVCLTVRARGVHITTSCPTSADRPQVILWAVQ